MTPPPARRRAGWSLAVGLVLLAPLCAEYLTGYDTSTGDPAALLTGLLFLAPLYGAPALLVREVARRCGVRWPGILALTAAFGVVQAGVVDQSMFSMSYRDIGYWDEMVGPTYVDALGFALYPAISFVAGHAIFSYGIPIAMVEALRPELARQPWLRVPGTVVATLLYLPAAGLILREHLRTETDHASPAQIAGALVVVVALVVAALTAGRRRPTPLEYRVPPPIAVCATALVAALAIQLAPPTWPGLLLVVAILAAAAAAVGRLARSGRWTAAHVVALGMGGLVGTAVVGFLVMPLGEVAPVAKYAHNAVFLIGSVALGTWAATRNRPPRRQVQARAERADQ